MLFRPVSFTTIACCASFAAVAIAGAPPCNQLELVPAPNPGSEGNSLLGVAGLSADEVWAVGLRRVPSQVTGVDEHPLVLRFDGSTWTQVALPAIPSPPGGPNGRLADVMQFADGTLWAVGSAVPATSNDEPQTLAMRFDGQQWQIIASPVAQPEESDAEFFGIGGVASNDFWAVGDRAGFLAAHWNGSSWQAHAVPPGTFEYQRLLAVSAIASDDVWAAGNTGLGGVEPWIVHWNGSSWSTPIPQPGAAMYGNLTDIKAFSGDDVWVSVSSDDGSGPKLLHWNGSTWEEHQAPQFHHGSFAGHDPNDFYSAGYNSVLHWDGAAWQQVDAVLLPFANFNAAVQLQDGTVWAVGRDADGSTLSTLAARLEPCHDFLAGDFNGDGIVTEEDRALLGSALGATQGDANYIESADFDENGSIDTQDQIAFNELLPPCAGDVVSSDTFSPPADGVTNGADLAYLLGAWGAQPSCADFVNSKTFAPPPDGKVDGADLASMLGAWGACE